MTATLGKSQPWNYVWVRQHDDSLGRRRYQQVARLPDNRMAQAVRASLEAAGHQVEVRVNNAQYPGT